MPKSWSFRASIPMRTAQDHIKAGWAERAGSAGWDGLDDRDRSFLSCLSSPLTAPTRVVEAIGAEHIATRARVHVRLPRRFFGGDHGGADVIGDAANIGEDRAAGGRHLARHRARLPEREPLALER